jgi:hypothetical protein
MRFTFAHRKKSQAVDTALLQHVSPLAWEHVGLTVVERTARLKANEAALAYLAEVDNLFPPEIVERLRVEYDDRIRQLEVCASGSEDRDNRLITPSYQRLQQAALDVERRTIIQLRDEYVINDDVLRRIQLDLDHAEARLRASP